MNRLFRNVFLVPSLLMALAILVDAGTGLYVKPAFPLIVLYVVVRAFRYDYNFRG